MKKSHITLLSISLIIVLIIGGVYLFKDKSNEQTKAESIKVASEESPNKTITHENGDFIYTPANEEIGYDSEEELFYYENLLNVFLVSEISKEQTEELASVVDGNVVGKLEGSINILQIQVEEKSIAELHKLAERLQDEDLVKFAHSSTPSFVSDLSTNNAQKIDEVNWWAKSINAYSAWEYMDKHKKEFETVKVTVIETGKLGKKEGEIVDDSINKKNVTVSKSSSKEATYETMKNSSLSHAELVTKIIAGDENSQTIRGVADPIVGIEFVSIGNPPSKEVIAENLEGYNYRNVGEAEIISNIKQSDQDDDVTIINNSWGTPPMNKDAWKEDEYWFNGFFQDADTTDEAYDEYLTAHRNSNDKISIQMIVALDLFLESEEENEFLIVQSAGNDSTFEAKETGFFANINDDTYSDASTLFKGGLESSPEDILDHIIIVGGAEQTDDKKGYQTPKWASFGESIDIVAPAENLFIDKDGDSMSGTSFAAPMVSGAVALIWSYNPKMKAGEVKQLLLNSAKHEVIEVEEESDKSSYPMLNMTAFLQLNSDWIEEVMRESYDELFYGGYDHMSEPSINHYETIDLEKFLLSGVDPNHPFYEDVFNSFYPEVKDIVTRKGMETVINNEYLTYRNDKNGTVFYPEFTNIEVLESNSEYFKVEQTTDTEGRHFISYNDIYIVEYVKEADVWKFAGAKKQE